MYRRLYNFSPNRCNIAGQSTNIPKLTDPWHYYTYKYDQLNRIRQSYTYKVSTAAVATRVLDYSERFTYDGNGNIDSAARYKGANTKMDSTLYHYNTASGRLTNNRLNYITDNITTHNYPYGLDNQAVNNYTYDAIGNMLTDVIDIISNINWSVYGKIQGLTNSKGTISYSYDPAGQRATKTVAITSPASTITTYYIRDAQGNTLAIYDNTHSVVNWREQDLYGSSRLGRWNVNSVITTNQLALNVWDTVGHKEYELDNHLGNVMVIITDKRIQHTTNGTMVDYFNADISTAQEYYAFGGLMAGRNFTYSKPFRYGFNGKEDDNDVKGVGNQQDYGMRIYDPRTGRFYSVDPLTPKYPELTPYQFASNKPILAIDLDGLETAYETYLDQKLTTIKGSEEAHQNAVATGRFIWKITKTFIKGATAIPIGVLNIISDTERGGHLKRNSPEYKELQKEGNNEYKNLAVNLALYYSGGKLFGMMGEVYSTAARVELNQAGKTTLSVLANDASRTASFAKGQFAIGVATDDLTVYRVSGGTSGASTGEFFSLIKPTSSSNAEDMLNINAYGNTGEYVTPVIIKKGSQFAIGEVEGGSGTQIFIPKEAQNAGGNTTVRLTDQTIGLKK